VDQKNGRRLSQYHRALALEALGQQKEATDKVGELANAPTLGEIGAMNYYVAGLAELHRQRPDEARIYFHKALDVNPSFWRAQVEVTRMHS
jgi:tetratricopeptide (TPR) repeat protein